MYVCALNYYFKRKLTFLKHYILPASYWQRTATFLNYHNSSLNANLILQNMCTSGAITLHIFFLLISIISREMCFVLWDCPFLGCLINPLCPTYIHKIHNSAQYVSIRATCYTAIPSHSGHPQYPGMYQLRSSIPNLKILNTLITLPWPHIPLNNSLGQP